MPRRSGLTLVEVLVAIFVMGIGMIALLTLFPIGVLQMAQAIRQDKCLRAAQTAETIGNLSLGKDAMGNGVSLRYDATMLTNPAAAVVTNAVAAAPWPPFGMDASFFTSYSLPTAAGTLLGGTGMPPADPYGASYAVMVDPQGVLATLGLGAKVRPWVAGIAPTNAGVTTGALMRRTVSFAGTTATVKQWFSLPDDLVFDNDPFPGSPFPGSAKLAAANTIMRDTPFSWTFVLQRPRTGDTSVVNCTIVIWENRPQLIAGLTNKALLPEFVFTGGTVANPVVAFDTNANTITITTPAGTATPNVRVGDWLYDATIILPNPGNTPSQPFPEIMSAFYRVVAVDEISPNSFRFEVQQTIKKMVNDPTRTLPGTVIVMEGISEVFDRGPVRVP